MSMHSILTDRAIEAMPTERRAELSAAAATVAGVFGYSQTEMIERLIPGTISPEAEAEADAMLAGERKCATCQTRGAVVGRHDCIQCRFGLVDTVAEPIPF